MPHLPYSEQERIASIRTAEAAVRIAALDGDSEAMTRVNEADEQLTRDVAKWEDTTDPHEMRRINGHVRAVYTDNEGDEYIVLDGERKYLGTR
jgi:hypothetical protein